MSFTTQAQVKRAATARTSCAAPLWRLAIGAIGLLWVFALLLLAG